MRATTRCGPTPCWRSTSRPAPAAPTPRRSTNSGPWSRPAGAPSATSSSSSPTAAADRSSARAQRVSQSLSEAGAHWVGTSVEPAMAMGPNAVVIVRSEYLLGVNNCPTYSPATIANTNEAVMPGFGCADAYNMGQMLARPRDAAIGRPAGPADATVNAMAIARYREGKVRALDTSGTTGGVSIGGGATGTN
jgi:type IV pilus biogenesis protein CpaD/CtpE